MLKSSEGDLRSGITVEEDQIRGVPRLQQFDTHFSSGKHRRNLSRLFQLQRVGGGRDPAKGEENSW